jgi:hypothetical protein
MLLYVIKGTNTLFNSESEKLENTRDNIHQDVQVSSHSTNKQQIMKSLLYINCHYLHSYLIQLRKNVGSPRR